MTTLDRTEHRLDPSVLVIADAERPLALAGIIGGADSEIGESTREVLVEVASFDPRAVRAAARGLGLATDASYRFERGVDPEGLPAAQQTAVRLLAELAGGSPAPGVVDLYPGRSAPRILTLRIDRVRRLLGFDPGSEAVLRALSALRLPASGSGEEALRVSVPSWRPDLEREADLIEEVARQVGYDRIPARLPGIQRGQREGAEGGAEERCRDLLAHLGFHEAFNYAMIGEGEDSPFVPPGTADPLAVRNPIADPLSRLRRSLLPGLLRAADLNLRRGVGDVRLFEVGRVFLAGEGFPAEPLRTGIAWAGAARPRHWSGDPPEVDFQDAAGLVETLLRALRFGARLERAPCSLGGLHPGLSAAWTAPAGEGVAWCGALHPALEKKLDLPARLFLAEVDLERLLRTPATAPAHSPLPRVPPVVRDLSLILTGPTPFRSVEEALRAVAAPAAASFHALDRYEGPPLAAGETSLTVRVILEPLEQTLTDAQTDSYCAELVRAAEGLGLRLRGQGDRRPKRIDRP